MRNFILLFFLCLEISVSAQEFDSQKFSKHVHYLASEELQGRALGTDGKEKAFIYIQNGFKEAGLDPFLEDYTQEFDLKMGMAWVKAKNIIGIIEGTDPFLKDEYLILGAHYDHLGFTKDKSDYFPGADDNASGVATILELAKYFNQDGHKPKRSLIFIAFDAEEAGLLGSKHFVENLEKSKRDQIKAMFSFDMVGMLSTNKGLDLKGISSLINGKELVDKYAKDLKIINQSKAIEERTDTESFGKVGIPSIHVFTGLKSPYHKPEDTADLLDYEGMETIAGFISQLVFDLGNQAEINAISSLKSLQKNPNKIINPFRVGLVGYYGGGYHNYTDEFYDAKSKDVFSVGLRFSYKFTKIWALTAEGLYDYNTSAWPNGKFSRQAFMVPVNIQFGNVGYVKAGAYYKYNFSGKENGEKLDFENKYRREEWGYNIGVGLQYSKYFVEFTSRNSFQSIYQQGAKVIPSAFYFSIGYNLW